MFWFILQSLPIIALAFALGLFLGWLWWGRQWKKVHLDESATVTSLTTRHETELQERDAEIMRLQTMLKGYEQPAAASSPAGNSSELVAQLESALGKGERKKRRKKNGNGEAKAYDENATAAAADNQATDNQAADNQAADNQVAKIDTNEATTETETAADNSSVDRAETVDQPAANTSAKSAKKFGRKTQSAEADKETQPIEGKRTQLPAEDRVDHTTPDTVIDLTELEKENQASAEDDSSANDSAAGAGNQVTPSQPSSGPTAQATKTKRSATPYANMSTSTQDIDEFQDDELERIEGIGPRIGQALRKAGIRTYIQLAQAEQAELNAALEASGLRFAPSLPTWGKQAELLAEGDEEGFKKLSDDLVGRNDVRSEI